MKQLPCITITPQTEHELAFYREMLLKMNATFYESKSNDSLLNRFEEGLIEAKNMKLGKIPKKPLYELYEND